MHDVIRLSPSWPQRLHHRLERWIDRLWSLHGAHIARSVVERVGRLPSWSWPLLVALAAWPSATWTARRLFDDSDDPLGIVALAALGLALWHARSRFNRVPRTGGLALAAVLVVTANLPVLPAFTLPELMRALMASVAIVVALAAIADRDEPIAPYAGLAVLGLPLLSSLQFYAGFPLRVVTAEASRWLLTATGATVERLGTALTVNGHLVLVDAPCSGVRMAWVGYFVACATAWLFRVSNRAFLARLPLVGATVLTGNIVRNTVLVAAEADAVAMTDAMHAAVGLVVFTIVAAVIARAYAGVRRPKATGEPVPAAKVGAPSSAAWLLLATLAIAASLPLVAPAVAKASSRHGVEWPLVYDGLPLLPLALSPVELRFATQFPGTLARFANGERTLVMRDVEQPTRRLHPAVDCYRGIGYTIASERLERDASSHLWRCFEARPGARPGSPSRGDGLRVCERIVDGEGHAWTDVSSWYWAAVLSPSSGPWRAVTIATPIVGAGA